MKKAAVFVDICPTRKTQLTGLETFESAAHGAAYAHDRADAGTVQYPK